MCRFIVEIPRPGLWAPSRDTTHEVFQADVRVRGIMHDNNPDSNAWQHRRQHRRVHQAARRTGAFYGEACCTHRGPPNGRSLRAGGGRPRRVRQRALRPVVHHRDGDQGGNHQHGRLGHTGAQDQKAKKNQPAASDVDVEVADANPQPNPEYIKGPAGAVVLVHLFHPVDDAGSVESAWADTDKEYRVTTTDVSHTKFPMTAVLSGPRTRSQTGKVFNELYGTPT